MSNFAEVRPKLKQDSVFLQTKDGVFLRSDNAAFLLKGKSVYRWISALSPYMTGEHTLEKLCEGLEPAQRDTVTRLVDTLLQRGVLKNHIPEAADLLPDAVCRRFRSQIEFIDHYVDRPLERFKNFRESHILLIGSGESFAALALSLLRNGVREIFLASTGTADGYLAELEAEAAAIRQDGIEALISSVSFDPHNTPSGLSHYDFVVYCADDSTLKAAFDLQKLCLAAGRTFLSAVMFGSQAILGPLVKPQQGSPCWLCAQMRLAANAEGKHSAAIWRALALAGNRSRPTPGFLRRWRGELARDWVLNSLKLSQVISPPTQPAALSCRISKRWSLILASSMRIPCALYAPMRMWIATSSRRLRLWPAGVIKS